MLELFTDDPFRRQAEAIAVEGQRSSEVVDAERQNGKSWFHFLNGFDGGQGCQGGDQDDRSHIFFI
jgi:hypothetical protein